jgi:chromate transporter
VPGAISAATGTVLPTTLLMLIMVACFFRIKDSLLVQSMLRAVRPVVVGLLLWTAYDMAVTVFGIKRLGLVQSLTIGWDKLLIVGVSFVVLTFTEINPALIVLASAVAGGIVYR